VRSGLPIVSSRWQLLLVSTSLAGCVNDLEVGSRAAAQTPNENIKTASDAATPNETAPKVATPDA
jgi:hypothetical protein